MLAYDALCKNNPYLVTLNSYHGSSSRGSQDALNETDQSDADSVMTSHMDSTQEPVSSISSSNPDLTVTNDNKQSTAKPANRPAASKTPANETPVPSKATHNAVSSGKPALSRQATSCPSSRRTSSGSQAQLDGSGGGGGKFEFDVTDLFMLGSPLALVLAYRKSAMPGEQKLCECYAMYLQACA